MSEYEFPFKLISIIRKQKQSTISLDSQFEIGGKALGLLNAREMLNDIDPGEIPGIHIDIPEMVVIGTSVFDAFMECNPLAEVAFSTVKDNRIAHAFQQATIPFEVLGDLRNLLEKWSMPLAIRSSGLLEDSMQQPFAGVYLTKMIPNNAVNLETRFQKLVEAIKFVWASTYFRVAKDYCKATNLDIHTEKMAVIIQKMVGKRHQNRYYPELSGVARSYNFYPVKPARPEDGVVSLALGLGKTVVDGGKTWTYSPKYPSIPPPFKTIQDTLQETQNEFWLVNMSEEYEYNPIKETEYMLQENIRTAEKDQVLEQLVSTYDLETDRLSMGMGGNGPRVLTFAPLLHLRTISFNKLINQILQTFESRLSYPVEIEFAMTFNPHCLSLLQVRPMKIPKDNLVISEDELTGANILIASKHVLGNGILEDVQDIVYVKPDCFDLKLTKQIAIELANHNKQLLEANRPYILIVFGRLGTLDPWLGIPVTWGQICGARVIVEATQENVKVELSQGSHYFHNIINLDVKYFSMPYSQPYRIHWDWLENHPVEHEGVSTRHVKLDQSLTVKVDGKNGWGIIYRNEVKTPT
ncbi:MAG: hypothetical protein CVU41_12365 [Chloroflexi bacterium HGW-Chloroflexi-3]|nr:MAG: hypothetical protein CVU41_12365 [Chloroflexi bacterium HGW-Chloroflexi-3]